MNKAEIITAVSEDANISKTEAKKAIESFVSNTSKALQNGDRVALAGFGSFVVEQRQARTGRNPKTGESLNIPARKVVKFRPGNTLFNSVN